MGNDEVTAALCSENMASGILSWSPLVLQEVAKLNIAGTITLQEEQIHMVGYLFEMLFDLMIAPADNVSESPGFEACLKPWLWAKP